MPMSNILNYTISGEGPNVLFLHGFMENLSMWDHLIAHLPIRAIRIDLHGHGASFFDNQLEPSVETMADQVLQIVANEKIDQCIVVGHSLGGYVGLELMKKRTSFEHLVLFHSHPWGDPPEKQVDRRRVAELVKTKAAVFIHEAIPKLFFEPNKHALAIDHYEKMALAMLPEAIGWSALAMAERIDQTATVLKQKEKFTFFIGKEDQLVNVRLLESFCITNEINHVVFEETAHMAHEEHVEKTLDFFKAIVGEMI